MGVPAFFRWISEKYPRILTRCVEEQSRGGGVGVDASQPNPNGFEFDNLYLDMNGLIHPCTHPEGEEPPGSEEEMYSAIFNYVDRILNMIRPRKLVYMAIDGVAPRAKMNQQRSRRFRSAQEAAEAEEDAERIRKEMIARGQKPPPRKPSAWDSNVITPGTEFMATLSVWLRFYIAEKLNKNPAFKNVRVILSDAQSPGEGEHKIMQFIRRQRAEPGYDPNTMHCLYGLDADLIMLGLASHEIHFTILREEVLFGKNKRKEGYSQDAVLLNNKRSGKLEDGGDNNGSDQAFDASKDESELVRIGTKKKPFDIVKLWILREYLAFEFRPSVFQQPLQFPYNFEACIDDFVFMCFFVGNDFLPHLPSLSIREGGLELLIELYKRVLPTVGGYLTEEGKVILGRVDVFTSVLGTIEDEIFRRRRATELWDKQRRETQKTVRKAGGRERAAARALKEEAQKAVLAGSKSKNLLVQAIPLGRNMATERAKAQAKAQAQATSKASSSSKPAPPPDKKSNKNAAAVLKEELSKKGKKRPAQEMEPASPPPKKQQLSKPGDPRKTLKRREKRTEDKIDGIDTTTYEADDSTKSREDFAKIAKERERDRNIHDDVEDEVRLGEAGWRERYYVSKFGPDYRDPNSPERRAVVKAYVTGLCWVMEYYYRGCQSWTWFYEYHYAPFASDLVNIDKFQINFAPSMPFKPIEQLMGVFPPASAHALPEPCRWYMISEDSPIADFYPREFDYDPNGKAMRWLWVALLPFIDEKRLLKVTRDLEKIFTEEENERNSHNPDLIFFHVDAKGSAKMLDAASKVTVEDVADDSVDAKLDNTPTTAGDVRGHGMKKKLQLLLASKTNGISGYFLPPPTSFRFSIGETLLPPSDRLDPISTNKVAVLEIRLPTLRPHLSKIIPGTKFPPMTLSPQELMTKPPKLGKGPSVALILLEGNQPQQQAPFGKPMQRYSQQPPQQQPQGFTRLQHQAQHYQRSYGSMEPRQGPKRHAIPPPSTYPPPAPRYPHQQPQSYPMQGFPAQGGHLPPQQRGYGSPPPPQYYGGQPPGGFGLPGPMPPPRHRQMQHQQNPFNHQSASPGNSRPGQSREDLMNRLSSAMHHQSRHNNHNYHRK